MTLPSIFDSQNGDTMSFRTERLWTVDGRIRRAANPDLPAHRQVGRWEPRSVVLAAGDYPQAHLLAEAALLHNWSQHKHEAEVYAVRPATGTDLAEFAYVTDPGWRILVPEEARDAA